MDARKSHFMSQMWASIVIVLFTVVATIIIVSWSPMLPEAIAVDMSSTNSGIATSEAANGFGPYIALHATESWHYSAEPGNSVQVAGCPR